MDSSTKKLINQVAKLKRDVRSYDRVRTNVMISSKVKDHLKEKYGSVSNGINTLSLKDLGEL